MNRHFGQRRHMPMWTGILLAVIVASIPAPALSRTIQSAVVATAAADFSSGAHTVVSVDPVGGPRSVQSDLLPTVSDIMVAAYGKYFYRIERYQADNITKFDIAAPSTPIYQYSVLGGDETGSANPHAMIFLNDQKAYLLRYEKATAWIVNPSATTESAFKIGELDLSAYADSDGIPEMESGIIVNGKLFITLQRMDQNNGWVPSNTAYAAVFDTTTDTEIDTGIANSDGVKGIPLPVKNPGVIQYLSATNTVYLQGAGDYGSSWSGRDPDYSGGIVTIDPSTYAATLLVDDGDADSHPYGNISGMAIVSAGKGYLVGYAGWGDNTLYGFSPVTGAVTVPVHTDLAGKNIAGVQSGTYPDKNGMLWVCNQTDAQVIVLNTVDDTIDETIATNLSPIMVAFAETTADDSDGGYTVAANLWLKAVFQTPGGAVTLKWYQTGTDTNPSGDTVVSGYFYADPGDFAYGSMYNPEAFVKIYISTGGWANIVFNHVTVDPIDVYSAHGYVGTPQQSATITLDAVKVNHSYTGGVDGAVAKHSCAWHPSSARVPTTGRKRDAVGITRGAGADRWMPGCRHPVVGVGRRGGADRVCRRRRAPDPPRRAAPARGQPGAGHHRDHFRDRGRRCRPGRDLPRHLAAASLPEAGGGRFFRPGRPAGVVRGPPGHLRRRPAAGRHGALCHQRWATDRP